MDIKLKRSTDNVGIKTVFLGTKALAFLLCVALMVTAAATGIYTLVKMYANLEGSYYNSDLGDILMEEAYETSSTCQMDFQDKAWSIKEIMDEMNGQGQVNSGAVYSGGTTEVAMGQGASDLWVVSDNDDSESSLYRDYLRDNYQYFLLDGVSETRLELFFNSLDDDVPIMSAGIIDEVNAKAAFLTAYGGQLEEMKAQREWEKKENLKGAQSDLNQTKGFWYYATDGREAITNLAGEGLTAQTAKDLVKQVSATWRTVESGEITAYPQTAGNENYNGSHNWMMESFGEMFSGSSKNLTVHMGFDQNYVQMRNATISEASDILQRGLLFFGLSTVGALICLVYLVITWGRRDENGRMIMRGISRWFTDVHIALFCLVAFTAPFVAAMITSGYVNMLEQYSRVHPVIPLLGCAGMTVLVAVVLMEFLELVKKLKAKRFFKDMILIRLARLAGHGIHIVFQGTPVVKKAAIIAALVCIGSATIFFFPVMLIGAVYVAVKYAKMFEKIKKGVKIVKNGNPEHKIDTGEIAGELLYLAEDINELSSGFDVAVKQELKNQRLKTELISNVSHDIKTPLTSIITYVDLLKKEGLDSPDASKYLDILEQKSFRLKKLTEDLFEAAKASSGDIPVNLEKVELLSLINQGLGEMDRKLQEKGLDVIVKAQDEKYNVLADGQLLWRVVENLLGNAVKYAQKNSRVYIDLIKTLDDSGEIMARVEFKNISENPLNIPEDELMERFKRGDEARNTEGSGLGLSIAKDLMEMQNGDFFIVIDGDLFKAVFTLGICKE